MNQAEHFMAEMPTELQEAVKAVQEGSASSESTARCDFAFDDGSALIVTSEQGAEAKMEIVHPPEEQ